MSGIVNRIRIDRVRDTQVAWNIRLGAVLPAGEFLKSTMSLTENGPPLDVELSNPGPLGPNQTIFFGYINRDPDTTYWIRVWHEDALGNVLGESSAWVTTFPAGSVATSGDEFVECGDLVEANQDRASYGYNGGRGYGQSFRVRTVAARPGELGDGVA